MPEAPWSLPALFASRAAVIGFCSPGCSILPLGPEPDILDNVKGLPSCCGTDRLVREYSRWCLWPMLLLIGALVCGCRTPIHADVTSAKRVYRELHHTALDSGDYSDATRVVLHRYNWERSFRKEPAVVLRQLHDKLLANDRQDLLLALVELNYLHADHLRRSFKPCEQREARDFFLAASIYAYFYVLAAAAEPQSDWFNTGPGLARDFYNRSLGQAFLSPGGTNPVVRLEEGTHPTLVGSVEVCLNTNAFPWPLGQVSEWVMADSYTVKGLSVRNRQAGLGAPLIATVWGQAQDIPLACFAATIVLRVEGRLGDWTASRLRTSLGVYPGLQSTQIRIAGRDVPLEIDATAPLAYTLNNAALWKLGRRQFFSSRELVKGGIYRFQPYQPGAIPVVFVHGTFSSPIYWAEMWNTLASDPVLSRRCQFWFFIYNSGNPILWSAAQLRDALTETVNRLDPEGRDAALRQIVVVGHSQGGLLAKLTITRSGDKLWQVGSTKRLDELKIPEDLRAQLRRTIFVEPVPTVKRVIFVATPHRGSYLATHFVRTLGSKLVSLPADFGRYADELTQLADKDRVPPSFRRRVPTSLDGMSPKNPGLLALAEIPPVAGVNTHSIIAVSGHRPLAQDNDGLVAYPSAHVTYATSELVLHARHSCQGEPAAIEEVRRILLQHLAGVDTQPQ